VTFKDVVGIGFPSSQAGQLVLAHDAFVAIQLALYAVVENAARFGQQTHDYEASPNRNFLVTIGRKADGLAYHKFVC
jgi:hypothetical protein